MFAIELHVSGDIKDGFRELFGSTVMTSLRDLLGESSMRAILYHINMEKVNSDAELFHQRLSQLLGAPAAIIEEMIVKDLFKNLDLLYAPKGDFDFAKYSNSAKQVFESRERKRNA